MNSIFITLLFSALSLPLLAQDSSLHNGFMEDFKENTSQIFKYSSGGKKAPFTYTFGANSATEKNTKILLLKIDPSERAGHGLGPGVMTSKFTHFGTYSARIKIPNVRNRQPNVGAVAGYFTYGMDSTFGLSEIDFEWLLADPTIIYIGTWTGQAGALKRIGRTINLAQGIIYNTVSKDGHEGKPTPLSGAQNQPSQIEPLADYDASFQFYTYGFDWLPHRLTWWILHPITEEKIILWDYEGPFIPQHRTRYKVNLWHTDNWAVFTNPQALQKPLHPYELEVDWMSYKPLIISH